MTTDVKCVPGGRHVVRQRRRSPRRRAAQSGLACTDRWRVRRAGRRRRRHGHLRAPRRTSCPARAQTADLDEQPGARLPRRTRSGRTSSGSAICKVESRPLSAGSRSVSRAPPRCGGAALCRSVACRHRSARFAKFHGRSPELLGPEEVRAYQLHLWESGASWTLFNQAVCALRFLYSVTLRVDWSVEQLPYGRRPRKLRVVLSQDEVARFLQAVDYPSTVWR